MKVEFKKLDEKSIEIVRLWRNKPEISKFMYTDHIISKKEHQNWFNRIKDDEKTKFWVVYLEELPIGIVTLFDIDHKNKRCFWGYYIAELKARGKGLGKIIEMNVMEYIFKILNFNKLCCEVFSFNKLVIKIHKKYGSRIEGHFKEHIFKGNKFYDIVCMAILKEEWNIIKSNFEFQKVIFE